LRSAPRPEGPWSEAWSVAPRDHTGRMWLGRYWEDCFLWIDRAGWWHMLAHTYLNQPFPAQSISGHGFSRDGREWQWSRTEPYTAAGIRRVDGSIKNYSTLERPKLLFADPGDPLRPTHLLNGASPVWPCAPCHGSKDQEGRGSCVKCKVTPHMDFTYTVVRPLAAPV
jgi:hypothetical protein